MGGRAGPGHDPYCCLMSTEKIMTDETLKQAIIRELNSWDRRFDGAETIAENILEMCWDEVNQWIKTGPLPEPAHSERNGLILATNTLHPHGSKLLESGGKKIVSSDACTTQK